MGSEIRVPGPGHTKISHLVGLVKKKKIKQNEEV
ncbi:hypothetical protein SAMN05421594_4153 [Chryseobacterium oleae]|uniref:Uncharacterized protein n=1 Tax=Chryseobacterium oleae TaxID=491207 RepID=A0A1I5BSI7_CHROL|nr:hypothetical protein SAMN05421594_4153 [Chryseobacterium oleae]